jgi:hypothetical protein
MQLCGRFLQRRVDGAKRRVAYSEFKVVGCKVVEK